VVQTEHNPGGTGPNAVWSPANAMAAKKPGAIVFDAVHRSVLVRFPGSAQKIADRLQQGYVVDKLELLLPHRATELWAEGYSEPPGMSFLGDTWVRTRHAGMRGVGPAPAVDRRSPTRANLQRVRQRVAYWEALRRAGQERGPFSAAVRAGRGSARSPEGRLDITPLVTDVVFGKTLADRLRGLEGNGLLVRKWETYDLAFWYGGYEWGTATGGRGIVIRSPKLVVTFKPASPAPQVDGDLTVKLPDAKHGQRTAVIPTASQIRDFAAKHGFHRPGWREG